MKPIIVLFSTILSYSAIAQSVHLFKMEVNDKVGYVNSKGKIVINPIFRNGNEFSEGLAAVRLNGRYGFINEQGSFAINPQFDLALSLTMEWPLFAQTDNPSL